ncbi:MAG TPA: S4 domain-containing protein, partial [Gemmatimonadales bacterium]
LDRWLWAARFYKTRSVSAEAIRGGKVQVNGERAKAAKMVVIGDDVRVRLGPYEHRVTVKGLAERRGPAAEAQKLYDETADSRTARERLQIQLKSAPALHYEGKGRPTKRDRREVDRFKYGE